MRPLLLPPTELVYAIGDIHGRADLLDQAADLIFGHAGARDFVVVCLGDYVDRGPDSRGVIERLMDWQDRGHWICLMGNHEAMMVEGLGGEESDLWLGNGGDETLASYRGEVPYEHVGWLRNLPILATDAHRVYVHAGLMPRVELGEQDEDTCLWIRDRFLSAPASALPAHVVHGHTPQHARKRRPEEPELLAHRTNLDTGACWTGVLSIGVFEAALPGGPVEVLQATAPRPATDCAVQPRTRLR